MSKAGYIFRAILVFIIAFVVQAAGVAVVFVIQAVLTGNLSDLSNFFSAYLDFSGSQDHQLYTLIAYSALSILIFGIWYNRRFIAPFKGLKRNYQSGFTLLTILTLVIIAFGIQFIGDSIVAIIGRVAPAIAQTYSDNLSNIGIGTSFAPLMVLYVVILGPIAEELIFRGMIYRFARLALPFWFANILQAALFAIFHLNPVQIIYAFIFGLVLGYIAHRGHGIRYSVFAHIAVNALGVFAVNFFDTVTESFTGLSILIGVILLLFSVFVFSVEFHPLHKTKPIAQENDGRS